MLTRDCEWLLSRAVTVAPEGSGPPPFVGWQSEHTHAKGVIHLWVNSQVLLFLVLFGSWLEQFLAMEDRNQARLNYRPRDLNAYRTGEALMPHKNADQEKSNWRQGSPLIDVNVGTDYSVYDPIWEDFIEPRWYGSGNPSCSMVLYGPAGTGKTTLLHSLAEKLGWGIVTITPSDFIRLGVANVEQRATEIFAALRTQRGIVVAFDRN